MIFYIWPSEIKAFFLFYLILFTCGAHGSFTELRFIIAEVVRPSRKLSFAPFNKNMSCHPLGVRGAFKL